MTLDNHYVHGGQGEMIAAAIAALGLEPAPRVMRIGVTALPECGTNDEVLAHHGLDVAGLVASFAAFLAPTGRGDAETRSSVMRRGLRDSAVSGPVTLQTP